MVCDGPGCVLPSLKRFSLLLLQVPLRGPSWWRVLRTLMIPGAAPPHAGRPVRVKGQTKCSSRRPNGTQWDPTAAGPRDPTAGRAKGPNGGTPLAEVGKVRPVTWERTKVSVELGGGFRNSLDLLSPRGSMSCLHFPLFVGKIS